MAGAPSQVWGCLANPQSFGKQLIGLPASNLDAAKSCLPLALDLETEFRSRVEPSV
jgi:hypothetical protein